MLIAIGACAFNCMSHFISQSLRSFTQVATQSRALRMMFLCEECFYVNHSRIVNDATKKHWEHAANL
jgi:hypothetical protein